LDQRGGLLGASIAWSDGRDPSRQKKKPPPGLGSGGGDENRMNDRGRSHRGDFTNSISQGRAGGSWWQREQPRMSNPNCTLGVLLHMKNYQSAQARPSRNDHHDDHHHDDGNVVPFDATAAAAEKAAAAAKREAKKTFTSKKLTWVNMLMMDHRQQPVARLVGIAIAQTVNEDTEVSKTSDRVIADRLGISVRTVITSRLALRDGEWLAWHKPNPRAANRTKLVLTEKNIQSVEDQQIALKDRRDFEASEQPKRRTKS
jgi:hypothetical protein